VVQDVCLQGLPVVLAVDRGGLVGEDGPTHHGVFDLGYLGMLPGMTVLAPMDEPELAAMLEFAVNYGKGPVAIRYPRGSACVPFDGPRPVIEHGRSLPVRAGRDGCVFAVGAAVGPSVHAAESLVGQGLNLAVVNARFAKPLDTAAIAEAAGRFDRLATVEENVLAGGFGSAVRLALAGMDRRPAVLSVGLPDRWIEQGPRERLLADVGLSPDRLTGEFARFFQRAGA
jgi:1-deoxy-D-xylulose-5-phosphate synthase